MSIPEQTEELEPNTTGEEDDPRLEQHRTKCRILGIDGYGCEHIHDKQRNRVVVISHHGIDYQVDLDEAGRELAEWMAHVKEVRGWSYEQWVGHRYSNYWSDVDE